MRAATATQAKNSLGSLLSQVKRGETVLIASHGQPVATLAPVEPRSVGDEAATLQDLVARGILEPPRRSMDIEFICSGPIPQMPDGLSAADLIERDRSGR